MAQLPLQDTMLVGAPSFLSPSPGPRPFSLGSAEAPLVYPSGGGGEKVVSAMVEERKDNQEQYESGKGDSSVISKPGTMPRLPTLAEMDGLRKLMEGQRFNGENTLRTVHQVVASFLPFVELVFVDGTPSHQVLSFMLEGDALTWYQHVSVQQKWTQGQVTLVQAIAILKANFGVSSEVARVAFGQAWRMTGESARAYAARLLRLSSSIADFRESELRSAFVMRCANDHHRAAMSAMMDFNAMVLYLHTQEEQDALRAQMVQVVGSASARTVPVNNLSMAGGTVDPLASLVGVVSALDIKLNALALQMTGKKNNGGGSAEFSGYCYGCGIWGHRAGMCEHKGKICSVCNGRNHLAGHLTCRAVKSQAGSSNKSDSKYVLLNSLFMRNNLLYMDFSTGSSSKVEGGLLDSGAAGNVMSKASLNRLAPGTMIAASKRKLITGPVGEQLVILGQAIVSVFVGGGKFCVSFFVVDSDDLPTIFGLPFLKENVARWDFQKSKVVLKMELLSLLLINLKV